MDQIVGLMPEPLITEKQNTEKNEDKDFDSAYLIYYSKL